MIIFFAGLTQPTSTAVFNNMKKAADLAILNERFIFNPVRVDSQVPVWLKRNNSLMPNFLQSYYDWLSSLYGYTGVGIMDLSTLADISESPEFTLPHFVEMYAPDIKRIYEIPEDLQPSPENIRKTIINIRQEIYQRKSNEDAFKSLMASLFEITADTIRFSYPKRKILRLNAGLLEWMSNSEYYGTTGEYSEERYTMVGSHLNQGVLPDHGMWQDFSYLVTSEIDDSNPYYEAVVKETLHPAGIVGLYEKIEKFSEGGFVPSPVVDYEIPQIAHYYPYTLGSSTSLPKCSGCSGSLFVSGWTFPTFVYPSWDYEISTIGPSANFGSIILRDFFTLNSATGSISPNDIIGTSCVSACTATGSASFTWSVIRGSTEYFGLTGISANEVITFINESSFGFDRYLWQFATGATSGLEGPTYSYGTTGIRGVTLTAFKDSVGYQSIKGATFRIL